MTSQAGAENALGAVYQPTGLLLLQPCQAWEKDRTQNKGGEYRTVTPLHESSCGPLASALAGPGSVGETASLTPHIPAASGEGVTMGTNTKD